ncbi:MAG: hypothetical protein IK031_05125 [Bacteroidales bacterium]|nr:hypothetical protein [Bacteroidales bacterium]
MKKLFAFAGLMAAAVISLTNCQVKEAGVDAPTISGISYIHVSMADDTKTSASGMGTFWAAGDKINLFYGSASYQSLGEVTISGGEGTKSASFAVANAPAGSLKWYALYPYNKNIATPAAQTDGYTYVGDTRGITQSEFNSTEALCGTVCPLYGIAEGEISEVSIAMKHLTSAVELNLTNDTGSDIVVKSATLTASEDIIGSYYIAFASGTPEYTPKSDTNVKKSATVKVTNGALAAGASGKLYLAVKPFTQSSTEALKVNVEFTLGGENKSVDVELHPSGPQCVFTAGKMKKVGVSVTLPQDEPGVTTVSTSMYDYAKAHNCTISADKDIFMYKVLDLSDAVRMLTSGDDNCGSFWGEPNTDWRLYQAKGGNLTIKVASGCSLKSVKLTFNVSNTGVLKEGDKVIESGTAMDVTGTSVYYTVGNSGTATNGQIKITAVEVKYTGSGTLSPEEEANTLTLSASTVTLAAAGTATSITVTSNKAAWSIDKTSSASWLTVEKDATDNTKINISASANTGEERTTTFVVKHATDATVTREVTVKQSAPAQATTVSISELTAGNNRAVSNVVVDWVGASHFIAKDNTGVILVRYDKTSEALAALGLKKGDVVDISGNVTTGQNMIRFNNNASNAVTVTKKNTTGSVTSPVAWTGAQFAAAYEATNNAAKVTLEATFEGSYMYSVDGAGDVKLYAQDSNGTTPESGVTYTLTGYVYGWSLYNKTTKEVVFFVDTITAKQSGEQASYVKTGTITSGKTYLIVANNPSGKSYAASNLAANKTYGRLDGSEVTVSGNTITKSPNPQLEFVFTATDDGYSIAMSDGRLLGADTEHDGTFQIGDSYGHDFTVEFNEDWTVVVKHVATNKTLYHGGENYTNFSLASSIATDGVYPMLFEKVE